MTEQRIAELEELLAQERKKSAFAHERILKEKSSYEELYERLLRFRDEIEKLIKEEVAHRPELLVRPRMVLMARNTDSSFFGHHIAGTYSV